MRTREFINSYCKACDLFSEGDGCDAKWEDEVCSPGLEKYRGKRMIDRIDEYFSKKKKNEHDSTRIR